MAWCEGPESGMFDEDEADVGAALEAAPLTVFETHALFESRPAVSMLSLDYIFAETHLRLDGRPTLLVLDRGLELLRPSALGGSDKVLAQGRQEAQRRGPDGHAVRRGRGAERADGPT